MALCTAVTSMKLAIEWTNDNNLSINNHNLFSAYKATFCFLTYISRALLIAFCSLSVRPREI